MIKNILIVDDDPMTVLLTKQVVTNEFTNAEINIAMNGLLALQKIETLMEESKQINQTKIPDLIILDLEMPLMSGWEFLEHYTKTFYKKMLETVIIILSSSIEKTDSEKIKKYPAVIELISKPLLSQKIKDLKMRDA